jgi:hypothetical protein
MRFHAFWHVSQTRNIRGFGVGGEDPMLRHACDGEFGRKRVGGMMGNMLKRDESSW